MNPMAALAVEIVERIERSRTHTSRGVVTAVAAGGEVSFRIGSDPTPRKGRWVGSTAPKVGQTVVYLDEGGPYPIVFGATGQDPVGDLSRWKSYNPTWTASGTNPVLGNGYLLGRYLRAEQWCFVQIHLRGESATTWGAGAYLFGLPFAPSGVAHLYLLDGFIADGSQLYPMYGQLIPGQTAMSLFYSVTTGTGVGAAAGLANVSPTAPVTFGAGDMLHIAGLYPTA